MFIARRSVVGMFCQTYRSNVRWKSGATIGQKAEFDAYCLELVRSHDHEHYLSGLLMPKEYRGVYFAIHAFNVEIATIRDQIPRNSIQAGRIRFQFWRDSFQSIYSANGIDPANNQPVVHALNYYVHKYNLTSRWFERSLEARFQDAMGTAEFETMDELETYSEYTQSSLMYLLLEAMDIRHEGSEFAASHVGVSKGILTLLRGYEAHRAQGLCYLPRDVMKKHGLKASTVMKGPASPQEQDALQDVINDVASQAYAHLSKARELCGQGGLPDGVHMVLLPAVGCVQTLDRLQKDNFVPSQESSPFQTVKFQLNMVKYLWTKRF